MPNLFFPDNTVLVNFGLIKRLDLLELLLAGKGAWCVSIQSECDKSSQFEGLEALSTASSFLGDPYIPTQAERIDTHIIRDEMASPQGRPTDHLGEAETIAVIVSRFQGSFFVTDDADAKRHAGRRGIRIVTTWNLLKLATKKGFVTCADMHQHLHVLHSANRGGAPNCRYVNDVRAWAGLDSSAP